MEEKLSTNTEIAVDNERELGSKNIKGLFVKYSALTLVGMLAQAVMVIFEGIIIGNGLGAEGLACVGLIMPVEYLMLALGGFFAVGISTVAALKLGDGNTEEARKVYAQGMWFSIIFMVILSVFIGIFAPGVAKILGTPVELTDSMVKFIRIFMIGYPFCIIGHIVVYIARVDEKPSIATYALTGSAIVALVWLYVSIYTLKLGIIGTAGYYASSIGLWGVFVLYFIFSKNTIFKIHISDLKMSKDIILPVLKIGFPVLLVQASSTIFTIILNNFLGEFGSQLDIAAFAVINGYIVYILMMIAQSTTSGLQPIASYNLGAKLYDRVGQLIRVGIIGNIIAVIIVAIPFGIFAHDICQTFCGNEIELIEIATKYTKIIVMFSAFGLTANLMSGYFQAVDSITISTILGICRYILFAIPFMYILSSYLGVEGVWYAQPVSDVLAFALTMFFAVKEVKRLKTL